MIGQDYLEKMVKIQKNLLDFVENEENDEENFENLERIFEYLKINEDRHQLKSLLHLILTIGNNHIRLPNFFSKIEKILLLFKTDIKKYFSNTEIFSIFRSNKRILLFLIEEKIMIIDSYIANQMINIGKYICAQYPQYFHPEIKPFIENVDDIVFLEKFNKFSKENNTEKFYELRKNGENESIICQLIRQDLIEDFIIYVNKNEISVNDTIDLSVYETNSIIIDIEIKRDDDDDILFLIEYAAFYGSIQIFKYLYLNGAELRDIIWTYAIHGDNPEIISILEESQLILNYENCYIDSIKCHHNSTLNYFIQNNPSEKDESNLILISSLKYYNFTFIECELINEYSFLNLVKYDYYNLVDILLKEKNIDINNYTFWKYKKDYYKDMRLSLSWDIYAKKTALFLAVEKENYEIIELLLTDNNIDVNIINSLYDYYQNLGCSSYYKKTAFALAVEKENYEIIKLLLSDNRVDVNILNVYFECDEEITVDKKTALYLAIEKKNYEIIKLLLSNEKFDVNILNIRYLKEIPNDANLEDEMIDLNGKVDIWRDGWEKDSWENKVKWNNKYQQTALYFAIQLNDHEIIKMLLSNNKIDVNILNTDYSKGYNCHIEKRTALFMAIEYEYYGIVKLLLTNDKIDVNILNIDYSNNDEIIVEKRTALFLAVEIGNYEIIKLLLTNDKIDVNVFNIYYPNNNEKIVEKKTALFLAVKNKYYEIIKLLLTNDKIDVNVLNINYPNNIEKIVEKKTALFLAVEKEYIKIVELLLTNDNIDVNILNMIFIGDEIKLEKTALFNGIEKRNYEIINLLLSNDKIDTSIVNKYFNQEGHVLNGKAIDLAIEKGMLAIMMKFRKKL